MTALFAQWRRLLRNRSGVAMTEFALSLPLVTIAGMWGTELANFALVNMKVHDVAIQLADNASRIGDTTTIQNRKIYEADINDVFFGANLNGGKMLDLYNNGRVIISSLQVNSGGKNYIAWQRCKGLKNVASSYGVQGDIKSTGMGPTGQEVVAPSGEAVIFVEINYDYVPLVSKAFVSSRNIKAVSSFIVRDKRDLTQVYQLSKPFPAGEGLGWGLVALDSAEPPPQPLP